jgi:cell shape-determining protein MreD
MSGPMNSADVARSTIVVFLVVSVQHALLDSVRVAGAHAELLYLLPVMAGYVAGPERGASFGFATGLVADLFLPTTFGLSALVGCLLGYATGRATAGLVRTSWWLPPVVAALATSAGLCAYAILGTVLGEPRLLTGYLPAALVVAVPAAAIFAIPMLRLVAWAMPEATAGGAEVGGLAR